MPRFRFAASSMDSNDLAQYDEFAARVRRDGLRYMGCRAMAEITTDQIYDKDDAWLQFVIINGALMKIAETELVNGVLSRSHIEKNARLAAEKSRILAKHGIKGMLPLLEPLILPDWFWQKHPDLRGPRCDNPCLARQDYFAPCLDRPEVLQHYREVVRKTLEIAPEIGALNIFTNDSGAGICWCTGLYPGPNGPDYCKDIPMGKRMRKWFEAMHAGAADAGKKIEILFAPVHFGRREVLDVIPKVPRRTRLVFPLGDWASNDPFPSAEQKLYLAEAKRQKRPAAVSLMATLGWVFIPLTDLPLVYYALDTMRIAGASDADAIILAGTAGPAHGADAPVDKAVMGGIKRVPKDWADIDKAVYRIARDQVGARLAGALVSAWKDVDIAHKFWPNIADTNHMQLPFYAWMGSRWSVRPLVPAPHLLAAEEKAYYNNARQGRDDSLEDSFIASESTKNYKTDELKWVVAYYDELVLYMSRAIATLEAKMGALAAEPEDVRKRFMLQYRRVAMLGSVWRTQRNVMRCASIMEFFTGDQKDQYWHVIRKDESFLEPATYRRLFLEAMDDEIANCRETIKLLRESDVPLVSTGDVEAVYVLPHNVADQLARKIVVMEAHKKDIDVLFPGCPPETFTDPTYEWADRRFRKEKEPQ